MTLSCFKYHEVIEGFHNDDAVNNLAKKILSAECGDGCYLLGRNEHSENLANIINFDGFIDDYAQQDALWLGKRVVNASSVPIRATIVNCSMSISPISALKRLQSLGFGPIISYADLCRVSNSFVPLPDFVRDARKNINDNYQKFQDLYSLFSDNISRDIFNKIMSYRLTADYNYMQEFSVRLSDQYFEQFSQPGPGANFIDCGGFDGDTTQEFVKRYDDYNRVYLFEPSKINIAKARDRLKNYRDIEFVELGVSDRAGLVSFNAGDGSASSIVETGNDQIAVTTLDEFLKVSADFIKMDLEGWELTALRGARQHIAEDKPILAIAVYHDILDFIKIPEYVLSIQKNYKIYLRHYTEGWSETIMYFVPY